MEQPGYEREGQRLYWSRSITDEHGQERVVTIQASAIHQDHGFVRARLAVMLGPVVLAWDVINVDRNQDRAGLVNEVYPQLNGLSETLPKAHLKHELDLFCAGLWDAKVAGFLPQYMAGSIDPQPPSFLLTPYVIEGGGTIIFAPPGRGKSYVMLLMSVAIDAGLRDLWPVQQRRVLFINLERAEKSVADRLGNVNYVLAQARDRTLLTLNARGKSLVDVWDGARKVIDEEGVGCVMLDSISRAGAGDLNENLAGNSTIDLLNGLCPTWVALGHTPRNDENHVFGSQMFDAGADVCVQLTSQQEAGGPLGIGLQITKSNDVGRHSMQIIALEFSPTGLQRVRPGSTGEFIEVEAGRKQPARTRILEYLMDNGATNATKIAESLGLNRSNVAEMLRKDGAFVETGKVGKGVLYGAKGYETEKDLMF